MVDVALFGCGNIGSRWASILDSHPSVENLFCVDIDGTRSSALDGLTNSHFITMDVFSSDEFSTAKQAQYRALTACDIWIVGVGYHIHERFISLADSVGVDKILVEKPVSPNPSKFSSTANCTAFVNYVETIHPVVTTLISKMQTDGATITQGFHWRGKNSQHKVGINGKYPYEHPAVKDDLVHDISELYIGLQYLQQDAELELQDIETVERWDEITRDDIHIAPHFTDDAWTRLTYQTENGDFTIQGGFTDEKTRRFFFWVDEDAKKGYYANTLTRSYTSPAAYTVTGKEDIERVRYALESGEVVTKEDEDKLFSRVNSQEIAVDTDEHTFKLVFDRLLEDDPLPTYYDAIQIESIAEQFYTSAEVSYGSYF